MLPTTSEPQELKKHVGAIHIRNRLSLLQRKVANVLLLNAYETLLEQDTHLIQIKSLAAQAGFDSNDHVLLRSCLTALASTAVEWNLLDERGREVWGVTTMLASARVNAGTGLCEYSYSGDLRERLYNPDVYARINLAIQRKFTSSYALALYENCTRYRRTGSTGWWSLKLFRELMGVEDDDYPKFKELNRRVIKPAIKQINAESDIHLEVELGREDRSVASLRFTVQDNPQMALFKSPKQVLDDLHQDAEAIPGAVESGPSTELVTMLEAAGVSSNQVKHLTKEFNEQHIRRNLTVFEADRASGKVTRNPSGYLIRAIREDFATTRERPTATSLTSEHEASCPPTEADSALTTEALKGYQAYLESIHLAAYQALPTTERRTLDQDMSASVKNLVDQKMLAERGIEGDRRLRERFVKLLARYKVGQPLTFAVWANSAGYQLEYDAKAKHGQRVIGPQKS